MTFLQQHLCKNKWFLLQKRDLGALGGPWGVLGGSLGSRVAPWEVLGGIWAPEGLSEDPLWATHFHVFLLQKRWFLYYFRDLGGLGKRTCSFVFASDFWRFSRSRFSEILRWFLGKSWARFNDSIFETYRKLVFFEDLKMSFGTWIMTPQTLKYVIKTVVFWWFSVWKKHVFLMHFANYAKLHKIENSNISKDVEQKVRILMVFGWATKGQILNISKDVEQKSMFLGVWGGSRGPVILT